MNQIWTFVITLVILIVFSILGGLRIVKFMEDKEAPDSPKNLVYGVLFIVLGSVLGISTFLVFEPEGKVHIETKETGASKANKSAPKEPSLSELKEDAKAKKIEEWGEEKSLEQIRKESDDSIADAIKQSERSL